MDTPAISRSRSQGNSQRSTTACLRCRNQKLKCSRDRTVCARCKRLHATCIYPEPPNRRTTRDQQSSQHTRRTAARSREQATGGSPVIHNNSGHDSPIQDGPTPASSYTESSKNHASFPNGDRSGDEARSLSGASPILSDTYPNHLRNMISNTTVLPRDSDQPALPSIAIGLPLLEIYFTRIYNAPLLFYKPAIFQQYLEGKVHAVLLKAIFALAALFLHPQNESSKTYVQQPYELKLLSAYQSNGLPWANFATKEAMHLVLENPSLMVVQALECLQLYWFSTGEPRKGSLCLAMAYRSCHLLGYSNKMIGDYKQSDTSLESELGRRCFWACWISTSIIMEPEPYIRSAWEEVAMLPLPNAISHTPSISLTEKMDQNWCSILVESPNLNHIPLTASAFLAKMVGVWVKVQLFVSDYTFSTTAQNLDNARRLSRLATALFEDAISTRDQGCRVDVACESNLLILVHDTLYHQCQITLHSMVVPLFSRMPTDPAISPQIRKKSAEIVIHHADLFEDLLAPYFRGQNDVTCIPPLVGYGAFVIGTLFLAITISCRGEEYDETPVEAHTTNRRLATVESILHLLDALRVYWRPLQHPWEKLHAALQAVLRVDISTNRKLSRCAAAPENTLSATGDTRALEGSSVEPTRPLNSAHGYFVTARQPTVRDSHGQSTYSSHEQPCPWVIDAPEAHILPQDTFVSRGNGHDSQQQATMGSQGISTSLPSALQDDSWYNLPFAEVGVEFAGLEPSTLFQQGWGIFG